MHPVKHFPVIPIWCNSISNPSTHIMPSIKNTYYTFCLLSWFHALKCWVISIPPFSKTTRYPLIFQHVNLLIFFSIWHWSWSNGSIIFWYSFFFGTVSLPGQSVAAPSPRLYCITITSWDVSLSCSIIVHQIYQIWSLLDAVFFVLLSAHHFFLQYFV